MMKHIPIIAAVLLAVTGLTGPGGESAWAEQNRVGVKLVGQKTRLWCWAGSGYMVLAADDKIVEQCAQANKYQNRTDCCNSPTPAHCVQTGWPEFDVWGYNFNWTNWGQALSFDQLRAEIDAGRPVGFTWGWKSGGGHYMVASGYKIDRAGTQWVWVNDPWPVDSGTNRYVTYAEFVAGADHDTWENDYRICKLGGYCSCPEGWKGMSCSKSAVPFMPEPVAHWDFEDGFGDSVSDVSGFGHTGTLMNTSGTAWYADAPLVSFANDHSLQLDGVNDYMLAGTIDFAQADYSISAWMKTSVTSRDELLSALDSESNSGIQLEISPDNSHNGKLRYLHRFPFDIVGGTNLYSANRLDDGLWHHIAVVKLDASLSMYVDGVLSASATDSSTLDRPLEVAVGFLHSGSPRYFKGNIDDVRLYNAALSQENIKTLVSRPEIIRVKSVNSGKCLDESTQSSQEGGNVQQWTCNDGDNQKLRLIPVDGKPDVYHLVFVHSGKCLDVDGLNLADAGNIFQWSCNGGENQQYRLQDRGDKRYSLMAEHSGKVLDVLNSSTDDGANIQQWTYGGADNQLWYLETP